VIEPECGFGIMFGLCSEEPSARGMYTRADNRTGQETKLKVHLRESTYDYDNMRGIYQRKDSEV